MIADTENNHQVSGSEITALVCQYTCKNNGGVKADLTFTVLLTFINLVEFL